MQAVLLSLQLPEMPSQSKKDLDGSVSNEETIVQSVSLLIYYIQLFFFFAGLYQGTYSSSSLVGSKSTSEHLFISRFVVGLYYNFNQCSHL